MTADPLLTREARLDEHQRKQLIGVISSVIRCCDVPPHVHQAALTVIGWLAQRKTWEKPCQRGLVEARQQLEMHSE